METPILFSNRRTDKRFGNYELCTRRLGKGLLSLKHTGKKTRVAGCPNKSLSSQAKKVIDYVLDKDLKAASKVSLNDEDHEYYQSCFLRHRSMLN